MNSNARYVTPLMGLIVTSMQMVMSLLLIAANVGLPWNAFTASQALLSKVLDGVRMHKLSTGFIHRCAKPVGIAQDYARYLTSLLPSTLVGEPVHRIARRRCLVVLGVLCVMVMTPANATNDVTKKASIDSLKLYAHSRIVNYKQFQCFNMLITKESNWRVEAINPNGNHFGLGQMRNTKYRNLDGFRMIDWTLRYITHRYSGSSCKAYAHWQKHGWH